MELQMAGLALLIGFKHSYDTDHLLAVANFQKSTVAQAVRVSLGWAAGHIITAAAITALLFLARKSILDKILPQIEIAIGIMLIFLGIRALKGKVAGNKNAFGMGAIQGLASNDELLLITVALGVAGITEMITAVAAFSAGVAAGMVIFAMAITTLTKIQRQLRMATGVLSMAYGLGIIIKVLNGI